MSNASKLINYLQPLGIYLTFFTELDSNLNVGDLVFICGGNFDNTQYTDINSPNYDPFNSFATGYTVIAVDNTNNSNAITLNIEYGTSKFNINGETTTLFNPLPVYLTEEELLINPNQIREAYISKSYFKSGEFNGGVFNDGLMGEYNIKGEHSDSTYERQVFVDNLSSKLGIDLNNNFDYSTLTQPAINNNLKFNNDFISDIPAIFSNGIFLGGDFNWGKWSNKYSSNKNGKIQTLNSLNKPYNLLNESEFNINLFSNDNDGFGYATIVSGNFGRIYQGKHNVQFVNNNNIECFNLNSTSGLNHAKYGTSFMIFNDYIPYPLWKSTESNFKFDLQIRVKSPNNNKTFDINYLDYTNKTIVFKEFKEYLTLGTTTTDVISDINDKTKNIYSIPQIIFDESGIFDLEIYVKDNSETNGIRNIVETATILQPDIFTTVLDNVNMLGGDIWSSEFRTGTIASSYSQLNWWDGVFNGEKNQSFSENIRWEDGTWIDGNWKGDIIVPIKNYVINTSNNTLPSNVFYIDIPSSFKHLFRLGDSIFISYIKQSIGSTYLDNYTDIPTEFPINFNEFQLLNIIETSDLDNLLQVRLELLGAVDFFTQNVSLQYAKVSQSYFNKGVWNDGIWESGLRKIINKEILDIRYDSSTAGSINHQFTLQLNNVSGLYLGQRVEATNLEIVREILIGIIDGVDLSNSSNFRPDDSGTTGSAILTYIESLNETLTILNIDINTNRIVVDFPLYLKLETNDVTVSDEYHILNIRKKLLTNDKSELTESVWVNGVFNSGAWDGGVFRNGTFNSKLYFDTRNTGIQSVFQSGYWKNGTFTNSAFVSGLWENGIFNSGIVTNLYNNTEINSGTNWSNGDTVFVNATINDVTWKRGLMLNAEFNNGEIINGGIENITFNGGEYTNGLSIYDNSINSNRSGNQKTDSTYSNLSAPSIIYVDGDGWVQLDQPSYFQKQYNVIFKDFDRFPNPLDGQMFSILNRDLYGTRVQIDYSTSGDNPLYQSSDFSQLKPLVAIDNLADFTQIGYDYWLLDSTNNRILILNNITKTVDVLGNILLQNNIWNFSNLKFIACATKFNISDTLNFVYVIDTITTNNIGVDTLRRISLDLNNKPVSITNYSMILNTGEIIIDLKVVVNGTVNETVICLTNQNRILYSTTNTNVLKDIVLDTYITKSASITPLRNTNTNSIDLLVLNNNTISHLILDYNNTTDVYSIRTNSPILINGLTVILNNIISFTAKYHISSIQLFIIVEDAVNNNDIFSFMYNEFFDGSVNMISVLNDTRISYPIYRTKMSQYFDTLNSILLHNNSPLILAYSYTFKNTSGFGNPFSQVKLMEINSLQSLNGYAYWLYDDASNRLIFVDESSPVLYNTNTDVDYLTTTNNTYQIIKMTEGESPSIVYSIEFNGLTYTIRKTQRGLSTSQIFTINNITNIYDICYVDKLFILCRTINGEYKIVELNQSEFNINVENLKYYNSNLDTILSPNLNYINASFDIISIGTNYIGIVSASDSKSDFSEILINNTTINTNVICQRFSTTVNDSMIRFEENIKNTSITNVYSAFFATPSGIIKIVSNYLNNNLTHSWSHIGDNLFYPATNIKEIYHNYITDTIVVSFGAEFTIINTDYITVNNIVQENNTLMSFNSVIDIVQGDIIVGLSNSRLIEVHSTASYILDANINSTNTFNVGIFQQNSTSSVALNTDILLNNPKTIVKSSNNTLFFIDNLYNSSNQIIRTYLYDSISTPNYDIVYDGINQVVGKISDLSYLGINGSNSIFYNLNNQIKYFNVSSPTTHFNVSLFTGSGNIIKLSTNIVSGKLMLAVLTDINTIWFEDNTGWIQINNLPSYKIDDISLTNDGTQTLLYFIEKSNLHYIKYNAGFSGSFIEDVTTNVSNITENDANSELMYYNSITSQVSKITINVSSRNENFVKLADLAFNPNSNPITPNYIFLYNQPTSNSKGVIRQPYINNSESVRLNNQLNDISTGTFVKIIAIDDNISYALFNEGVNGYNIYKYDFNLNTVTLIANPNPVFRNSIINPSNINNYKLYPIDITHYNGLLVAIFQYNDLNVPSNFYDVFSLNSNDIFDKTAINWLYARDSNGDPLPIDNTGAPTAMTYPISVPSGVGNLQFLFYSPIAPHIYGGFNTTGYITLYFGNSPTTGNFLKIVPQAIITPLVANQYNDLIVKITIPAFDISSETITTVQLTNPITNIGFLNASSTGTTSITIGSDTITLLNNEIWAVFTNTSQFLLLSSFNVVVSSTLNSGRITSVSYNTGINDFRIYENSGNEIVIKASSPIDSIYGSSNIYQLNHDSTGIWDISYYDLNYNIQGFLISLLAPVIPSYITIDLLPITSNINPTPLLLDDLPVLDDTYVLNTITKGYKVSGNTTQTLSPYLTSRVLYNTILNPSVKFNNQGTTTTAHFVASRWNNNLFIGTWDEPVYLDNLIIKDFSVFLDGTFQGDFYNGFFLGGTFSNSAKLDSNIIQGHFISDNNDINISSGNIESNYRYDILKMWWTNNLLHFTVEGLYLDIDNYINTPISRIGKGSWIKIPNLFNELNFTIQEIWNSKIAVNGLNEITLLVNIPNFTDTTLSNNIVKFFKNREILIEAYEYAEYLFGTYQVLNVFEKDNLIYITINSNFNKFNQLGKYTPVIKPIITFNNFIKVLNSKTYTINKNSYTDFSIDMFSPLSTDFDNYSYIEKMYLKDSVEIIKTGSHKSYVQIPNYLQLFNTSLSKSVKQFSGTFTSALQNLVISDITPTTVGDNSMIQVNLPNTTTIIGHDIVVENSLIKTPTFRKDVYIEDSIFLSGILYSNIRTSAWLNIDEHGFSNGNSQIGDANNLYNFEGDNVKILNYLFEGTDYVWIVLENIILNVNKYHWISLRGFTGNKSQLIGATRSRFFRIEEVQDNLIKIRNPFLYYNDYNIESGTNFNSDRLQIAQQTMLLKGLEGSNVKVINSDALQFANNTFSNSIVSGITTNNWYYSISDTNTSLYSTASNGTNGLKATFTNAHEIYKKIHQTYTFQANTNYNFTLDYYAYNSNNTNVSYQVYIDGVAMINNGLINIIGVSNGKFNFVYNHFETKTVDVIIDIIGNNSSTNPCYAIVNDFVITNSPSDIPYNFYYGMASPSTFNGGDFYGNFNSIWNGGNFRNGNFNGEWYGSEENAEWNGKVWVETTPTPTSYQVVITLDYVTKIIDDVTEILGGASVEVGDFIYLNFNSVFNSGTIKETFGGQYGVVVNNNGIKSFIFETSVNIPTDKYAINITSYRKDYNNSNYLINDYNFNVKINDSVSSYKPMDWNLDSTLSNGTNGVLLFDGENHINTIDFINIANSNNSTGFSIDLLFNYNPSFTYQPLLSFQNSSSGFNGIKLYVLNDSVYLKYLDGTSNENVVKFNATNLSPNTWNHLVITFGTKIYAQLSTLDINGYTLQNITNIDNNLFLISYDICFIGKSLNLNADKSITPYIYNGKMDEIRIWNLDLKTLNVNSISNMRNFLFDNTNKLNKFINKYISELTAYFNVDKTLTLDTANYFPEEETYFVLKGNNTLILQDNLSGTNFVYQGQNLFMELDFFAEQYTNSNGEYKILTIQENRNLPNNTFNRYYMELIIKEVNNKYHFIIREKVTDLFNGIEELLYPLTNIGVDFTKDIIFNVSNNFYTWYNIILTDTQLFINGNLIGTYNLSNRNVFKHTSNTNIILGKYDFAYLSIFPNISVPSVNGMLGFIRNINLWSNSSSKDEYAVFRILSSENTDLYNSSNIYNSNLLLESGNSNQINVPYFNTDGSNNWKTYIYTSENNYTTPTLLPNDLNVNYLTTSLPSQNWLDGSDFNVLNTSSGVISSNNLYINNSNYLLTHDSNNLNYSITISNMSNFKFFGKQISDTSGNVKLNVTASGYLFFEKLISDNQNFPLFEYSDNSTSPQYPQVSTTDAIMFNNIIDIREYNSGFVKYVDRVDEFIIEFYGKSSTIETTITTTTKYHYDYTLPNPPVSEIRTEPYSFFVIRIDKINSNILTYIRRIGESPDQKMLGLRRSDGYWSYINDTSGLVNFYKQPNTKDFVIGYESTNGNVISSNNTEYIVFTPRFSNVDNTYLFAPQLSNKNYDYLDTNYGLSIFKQFKGTLLNQYKISIDGHALTGISKKYMVLFPVYENFISPTNPLYDFNEQYTINSNIFNYNGLNSEAETLVTRKSFFYNGNFNSPVWNNGIFVNGTINVDKFIWKYGIKHDGRLQGGESLINYAHWLGGYHLGDNDNSFVRNLVWLRGIFDGGSWEKGHWLSVDLNNEYKVNQKINNDWSIFKGGEWYSRVNKIITPVVENLFFDGANGTFGGALSSWNLQISNGVTLTPSSNPIPSSALVSTTLVSNSYGQFSSAFRGNSQIAVNTNTEYTITASVNIPHGSHGGVKIMAIGNSTINNIVNVAYRRSDIPDLSNTLCYIDIQNGDNNQYSLISENTANFTTTISHTFNSGDNNFIYIQIGTYMMDGRGGRPFTFNITNIQMIGENIQTVLFNPFMIQNHDSIWHGGTWESSLLETGEFDEFGNPIHFKHTYESSVNKIYSVNNGQLLTLPATKSIWLGGLWLRGIYDGGIFANGYWNSIDITASSRGYAYENDIEGTYNSTSSVFYNGQMMNSIWYGGTVINNTDKLDVVFGELVNLYSYRLNSNDFVWNHDEFKFKSSNFTKAYSNNILGRPTFTGYHYDPVNDGSSNRINAIEINRVKRQVNSEGIMSVYWKRGSFGDGMFQFSHWDSLNLNNDRQLIISEEENKNNSIFRSGLIHSSYWKSGLFYANASRDRYPFKTIDEPNSLFYYSHWERGYWKAVGLKNIKELNILVPNYSSLDTTDNIEITNALMSRSIWDAGVFEGGTIDLSIWRSGVSDSGVVIEYKNSTVGLVPTTNIQNLAFTVSNHSGTNTDFVFSTNNSAKGLEFITNDSTFIPSIKNTKYRWVGSVDNMASIFVNGHMKGSIWHGGIWQRGMFEHKNINDIDFFDRNITTNTSLDNFQLGVWNRGLWLSGYFSYYDDAIINKKSINPAINNSYLFNNASNVAGRRSLFMSIDSENVIDTNNILGVNSVSFTNLVNTIQFNVNDKNNYASFFMRRLLKVRTDRNSVNVYPNPSPYFSVMNGSVLNGVLYQNLSFTNSSLSSDRYILSLFATVSDSYNKTASNNQARVSNNNILGDGNAFIYNISSSLSSIDVLRIPYSNLSPLTWDTSQWTVINNNNNYIQTYLGNYNNGYPTPTVPFPDRWRHNYDETTLVGVSLFGDGTIVNGTAGLREMYYNSNNNKVQISIAQGDGMSWIIDEPQGEPKYKGDEMELNLKLKSFQSNIVAPLGKGFDDTDFDTNL